MADDKPREIISGLDFAKDVLGGIITQVILRGGTKEDIYKLNGPPGCFELYRQIAALLVPDPPTEEQERASKVWILSLEELMLEVRIQSALRRADIETIGDLASKTEAELGAIPNIREKSIEEIKQALAREGLKPGTQLS
jgi:hypothetical protein